MKSDWDNLILEVGDPSNTATLAEIAVRSPMDLRLFEQAIQRGQELDRPYILYKGTAVDRTDEVLEFIEGVRDVFVMEGLIPGDPKEATRRADAKGLGEKWPSLGLKIRDNLEDVEIAHKEIQRPEQSFQGRLPASLSPKVQLYPYQKQGVFWLQGLHTAGSAGALLADDMGLGKTLQVLSFVVCLMEDGTKGPYLVVAPVSLLDNWQGELVDRFLEPVNGKHLVVHGDFLKHHTTKGAQIRQRDGTLLALPHKKVIDEAGKKKIAEAGLVITNYETVRSSPRPTCLPKGRIPIRHW